MTSSDMNFKEIFDAVQMDENAKKAFLVLSREEQLLAILGMQSWLRAEVAVVKKDIVDIKRDLHVREHNSYREDDETMSTTQRVINTLTKRYEFWLSITRSVLEKVLTVVLLVIIGKLAGIIYFNLP